MAIAAFTIETISDGDDDEDDDDAAYTPKR
jgi:hypothetical protein